MKVIVVAKRNAESGGNEIQAGQQYELVKSVEMRGETFVLLDGDGTNYVYWPAEWFDFL